MSRLLTAHGARVLSQLSGSQVEALRDTYGRLRFFQLEDVLEPRTVVDVVERTLPRARAFALRDETPHTVEPGRLYGGARFNLIDWGIDEGSVHSDEERRQIQSAFAEGGLEAAAAELAEAVRPFLAVVTGEDVSYDRPLLLLYGEGDFIDPHGDSTTKRRVMVQTPVCFGCRNALRVLEDGFLELHYDEPGCLRVLGPGIWHDVLPVLRLEHDRPPERVLISLRFSY
jgi:hypothetical protein